MFDQIRLKLICFSLFVTTAFPQVTKSNYTFLGCFLGDNLQSLGDESRILTPTSPRSCSEFCSSKQYAFFILKNDTCYCSKNYISRLMKEFDHECKTKCSGDSLTSCGGPPNFVSSYITNKGREGSYPIPIYLGCYSEIPNDDENRLLKGPAQPYNNNSPQSCLEICYKMGYLLFGVTYGSECWCGNQKPLKSSKVENVNCNTPCSGDSKQFCGGGWKMGIYSTGITDYEPKNYIGCFQDDENNTKNKNVLFQMGKNNSPKRCLNLCDTERFKYAAVKGNVCKCMNYLPNFNVKKTFSDCNTLCPDNPSENCGGSLTLSIYKTLYLDAPGSVKMSYVGCFNNLKRHPVLNGWSLSIQNLTPKQCVNSCFTRRYPYAALLSSKECLCSFIKPADEAKTEENMCSVTCSGSSRQFCGGINAINVYSTGLEWKTKAIGNHYLGCFEESESNRIFNGYAQSFSTNTPEFCSNVCYKFGYTYSGVTYKVGCFCGSQSPNENRFPKVEDKQCNTKCSGDSNQFCGGGWKMGVFSTGLNNYPVDDRFLGCFVQQENVLNDVKFELINSNTPSICSAICNNDGYRFSGLLGLNCFCGNRAPSNDQKSFDADCDKICPGDVSQTCGGEDRIQVYDLKKLTKNEISNTSYSSNFIDEFDTLNLQSLWTHEIYIAQEPDFEFVVYNNAQNNAFVKNGELIIKPTIQSDDFIKRGSLTLNGCTKTEGSDSCTMNATLFNIIPPIVSAKLTTKNYRFFQYGEIEVVAKLSVGDWIISEIALISRSNEQNKIILASLFGNTNLTCNGDNESGNVLKYGLKIDEQYHIKSNLMKSISKKQWSDDYHSFIFSRTVDNIIFKIDGESHRLDTSNIPLDTIFNADFYISIGLSVGGMINFRDGCLSNGHLKPWKNLDTKAKINFWRDKDHWAPTWNEENSSLRVKSLKFTALEINN